MQRSLFQQKMGQQDQHTENRPQRGGQRRAADTHVHGVHKHIVQEDIGRGTEGEGEHRQFGAPVVPRQPAQQKAEDQKRRESDDIPHVLRRLAVDGRRGPQKCRQRIEKEIAQQNDDRSRGGCHQHGDIEGSDGFLLLPAPDLAGDQDPRAGGNGHGQ